MYNQSLIKEMDEHFLKLKTKIANLPFGWLILHIKSDSNYWFTGNLFTTPLRSNVLDENGLPVWSHVVTTPTPDGHIGYVQPATNILPELHQWLDYTTVSIDGKDHYRHPLKYHPETAYEKTVVECLNAVQAYCERLDTVRNTYYSIYSMMRRAKPWLWLQDQVIRDLIDELAEYADNPTEDAIKWDTHVREVNLLMNTEGTPV